jgi:hypothetical protein
MGLNNKKINYMGYVHFLGGVIVLLVLTQPVFSYHGNEILLRISDGQFLLLSENNVHQIRLTVTYSVSDPAAVGKQVSATMKVYASNGTLMKTTSIPNGFKVGETGFQQFVTSFPNSSLQSVTATVLFTDFNKTSPLSNLLTAKLTLNNTL